jgi:hypothetical protein
VTPWRPTEHPARRRRSVVHAGDCFARRCDNFSRGLASDV